LTTLNRVARWFIFKPKIRVNFGGSWNAKGWCILRPFGIYYGHLVHLWPFGNLEAIWYISPEFWYMYCVKKNLATLIPEAQQFFTIRKGGAA
jgi:hypothetical protein